MKETFVIGVLAIAAWSFAYGQMEDGKANQRSHDGLVLEQPRRITLLLPFYLDETFSMIFESYGFSVIWAETQQELEKLIESTQIDLAIEWQHSERDFTILNLLRRHNKKAKIFLALNWNQKIPPDFNQLGYVDVLEVPFRENEMQLKFYNALPDTKKSILMQLPFWGK